MSGGEKLFLFGKTAGFRNSGRLTSYPPTAYRTNGLTGGYNPYQIYTADHGPGSPYELHDKKTSSDQDPAKFRSVLKPADFVLPGSKEGKSLDGHGSSEPGFSKDKVQYQPSTNGMVEYSKKLPGETIDLGRHKEKIVYQRDHSAKIEPQSNLKGHGEAEKTNKDGPRRTQEDDEYSDQGNCKPEEVEKNRSIRATEGEEYVNLPEESTALTEDLSLAEECTELTDNPSGLDPNGAEEERDVDSNLLDKVGRPNTINCSELDWEEESSEESDCEKSVSSKNNSDVNDCKRKAENIENSSIKQKKLREYKFHLY
jgi:hypothetical protein